MSMNRYFLILILLGFVSIYHRYLERDIYFHISPSIVRRPFGQSVTVVLFDLHLFL